MKQEDVGARTRLTAALATWTLLFLASPGVIVRDGLPAIACLALVPWARWCSRPGPKAFRIEWLAAGVGSTLLSVWMWYVWPGTLLFLVLLPGLYMAGAGVVLRRLARRFPLAIAAPVAWLGFEALKHVVVPPLGFGWMRLGTYLHATPVLAGSARVWGAGGLSFVLAALAGLVADLIARRGPGRGTEREASLAPILVAGLAPLALALALSAATAPPATTAGPRVLLVQPAFEQVRKMNPPSVRELFEESLALTQKGLADARAAQEPDVDLVAWGETMFPLPIVEPGVLAAWDRGARPSPWERKELDRAEFEGLERVEREWIADFILAPPSRGGLLPPGTSFLSGAENYVAIGDAIRRRNAVALWSADGKRAGLGGKVHLVPAAEQMFGLERYAFLRDIVKSVAGYVPDLAAFDRTEVFELRTRAGRSFRFGVSVCFDNVYDDPYTAPLRREGLDFHLVCSNEAWYVKSFEYDQMVAFSRLIALETGRSIVRATNSGITIVIDPEGREVARLERRGEDRMVPGTLRVSVPVPADASARTPFVRFDRAWLGLWIVLPILLVLLAARGSVTAAGAPGRGRA